jgi:lysophospholipase L1-like esterase
VVVGDSLTYGFGIKKEWTYSANLQRLLGRNLNVEVLNLGHNGFQSEDVAAFVKEALAQFKPDRIIYGVCLNDFLPAGVVQKAPSLIPRNQFLFAHTSLYPMLDLGLINSAIFFGFRPDFYGQVAEKIDEYSGRFAEDVKRISKLAADAGLPPVIGMVLDQQPSRKAGYHLMKIAEQAMHDAGFEVVDAEPYYATYADKNLNVSRWEGHPNEAANSIFAAMIEPAVRKDPRLGQFVKSATSPEAGLK